jgi:hypothetical protein
VWTIGARTYAPPMRDIETIDPELLVAGSSPRGSGAGGPLPSIAVADAQLDERDELTDWATTLSSVRARDALEA